MPGDGWSPSVQPIKMIVDIIIVSVRSNVFILKFIDLFGIILNNKIAVSEKDRQSLQLVKLWLTRSSKVDH